jgi:hypothetical protein
MKKETHFALWGGVEQLTTTLVVRSPCALFSLREGLGAASTSWKDLIDFVVILDMDDR